MKDSNYLNSGQTPQWPSLLSGYLKRNNAGGNEVPGTPLNPVISNHLEYEKRKREMYKNVLTFPRDVEHLNFFEKNPHPDRINEKELAIFKARGKQDLNSNILIKEMEFENLKNYLAPKLSDMDRKILRMPDALKDLIKLYPSPNYIKAYTHLLHCFYNYYCAPINSPKPPIQWVSYYDATSYPYAQDALREIISNLFNVPAMDTLAKKLHEANAFHNKRQDFYFWNTDPRYLQDLSYQMRPAIHFFDKKRWVPRLLAHNPFSMLPQYLALGDFTINALPEGYVQPKGNGKYDICVNKVFLFANDSFNFEGDEYLGAWDLNMRYPCLPRLGERPMTTLFNSSFREFRRHGYGGYFPVLSRLHEVENLMPMCVEYPYAR